MTMKVRPLHQQRMFGNIARSPRGLVGL